jgi:uncharacterized membrane protein YbhN (UPF0104 family)
MPKVSLAKRTGSILLVLIIFLLLGRALYFHTEALRNYQWELKYHLLFASFIPLALNYMIAAYIWAVILRKSGWNMRFSQSFRITYLSASGKYIPGRIWTYVGRVYLAAKAGISHRLTLASMALMFVTYNGIAILFFLCTLFLWQNVPTALTAALITLIAPLLLLVLHPKVLSKTTNFSLRLFKKEEVEIRFGYRSIMLLLGLLVLDRMIFSSFAYLFINSFMTLDWIATIKLSGIFSVAVFLGMTAFIVPAGLGVREGIQTYLLSSFVPVSTAILIPLALRLCMTLGELVCFAVALKIRKADIQVLPSSRGEKRLVPCGQTTSSGKNKTAAQPLESMRR